MSHHYTMAKSTTSAKSTTATATVQATPETATMPVETTTGNSNGEYTTEKIGRKTLKGNVGNMEKATIQTNADGVEFLAFDLCVNGKDENGKDIKTWFTVRTSHTKLKDVIQTGELLEVEGNHFVSTRNSDGKTYNRLNAFKVTFC